MAKNGGRSSSARAAEAAKVAEIRSRGWGLTSLEPAGSRRVMTVGVVAVLASTALYGWLLAVAVTDRTFFIRLSYETNTYSDEYGSRELSNVAATAGPAVVVFIIGWLLIVIAGISRRRPRPVPTVVLVTLSAASLLLWLAVVPLQFATGVLPGDPSFDGGRSLIVAPAVIFALGAVAPVAWLVIRRFLPRDTP